MSFRWDSLRAHTGCLKLFDLDDLAVRASRLQLRHEQRQEQQQQAASDHPRAYHFKRVTPSMLTARRNAIQAAMAAAAAPPGPPPLPAALRPSVVTESAMAAGYDTVSMEGSRRDRAWFPGQGRTLVGENGLVVFVQEDAKISVMRDRRQKEDLQQVGDEHGRKFKVVILCVCFSSPHFCFKGRQSFFLPLVALLSRPTPPSGLPHSRPDPGGYSVGTSACQFRGGLYDHDLVAK